MTSSTGTPSQTVGPFFHDGLLRGDMRRNVLATATTAGDHIRIVGHVYDGDGQGVPDALLETWQADHHGRYNHPDDRRAPPLDPAFTGFGRCGTDAEGAYWFETIKPGRVPFDTRRHQAPHICIAVFARGLLNPLLTRLYFADEPANARDPVLKVVPTARRATLIARRSGMHGTDAVYRFDVVLQGRRETVYFNY